MIKARLMVLRGHHLVMGHLQNSRATVLGKKTRCRC